MAEEKHTLGHAPRKMRRIVNRTIRVSPRSFEAPYECLACHTIIWRRLQTASFVCDGRKVIMVTPKPTTKPFCPSAREVSALLYSIMANVPLPGQMVKRINNMIHRLETNH